MAEIFTMGEIIVEIMREEIGCPLDIAGRFMGPYPSGAPAIFIDAAARLGHDSAIIGGVGHDDFGKCLIKRLKEDGVDCSNVNVSETPTGCAFVTYFYDGSREFIFHIGNSAAVEAKTPSADCFKDAKLFHIMGCSLMADPGFGKKIVSAMKSCYSSGAIVSFDPNIRPELMRDTSSRELIDTVLNETEVFLPGVGELLTLTGAYSVDDAVKLCFQRPKMKLIAVKNGSKGCIIFDGKSQRNVGIFEIDVADSTGAGDCFDATFLCSLLEGRNVEEAAVRASAAAALNTAAFGPMEGKFTCEILEKFINERGKPKCSYQVMK